MGYILQDWYVLTEPSGTAPFGIGAAKRLAFCSIIYSSTSIYIERYLPSLDTIDLGFLQYKASSLNCLTVSFCLSVTFN